jgi:hypothetical protein
MTKRHDSTTREFSPATIRHLAAELAAYLTRPGSRGASTWLDSKRIFGADRTAILRELHDLAEDAA